MVLLLNGFRLPKAQFKIFFSSKLSLGSIQTFAFSTLTWTDRLLKKDLITGQFGGITKSRFFCTEGWSFWKDANLNAYLCPVTANLHTAPSLEPLSSWVWGGWKVLALAESSCKSRLDFVPKGQLEPLHSHVNGNKNDHSNSIPNNKNWKPPIHQLIAKWINQVCDIFVQWNVILYYSDREGTIYSSLLPYENKQALFI